MNKKINEIVDILDECAMLFFEDGADPDLESTAVTNYRVENPHTNFFECLIAIYNYFLSEKYPLKLKDEETLNKIDDKLNSLEKLINEEGFTNDEIRKALLFLDIKAFKNLNYDLDLITPDVVGIIMAKLVSILVTNKKKMTILDPNVGTGNLLFTINAAMEKDASLIGIDSHELMCKLSACKANMLQMDSNIYLEDALTYICHDVDIVVSDPATYDYENPNYKSPLYDHGVRYFPYLLIEHLLNMDVNTKYCMVVDADFFNKKGSNDLKLLPNFNIKAFITLPKDMFQDGIVKKGILVFDNNSHKGSVDFFMLPSIKDSTNFLSTFKKIEQAIK